MFFVYYAILIVLTLSLVLGYKGLKFLWIAELCIMALFFSFSVDTPDYIPYKNFFEEISIENFSYINGKNSSILFSIANVILKSFFEDFNMFRLFLTGLVFSTSYFLLYEKLELGVFLICYAPVLFFYDLVQIRFFLAVYFCLLALFFLLKDNKFLFVLFMLCGVCCHSMVFICFAIAFIPVDKIISVRLMKFSCVTVLLLFSLLLLNAPLISFLQKILSNFSMVDEYRRYLEVTVRNGYILFMAYQVVNLIIAFYVNYKILPMSNVPKWNVRLNNVNYNIQILGIFFIIFTMINPNFSRYFRMLYVLNAMNFASLIYLENRLNVFKVGDMIVLGREKRARFLNACLLFVFITSWWLGESFVNHGYVTIINSIDF